ncbi:MAG: arylamine N-acetyltransferase [Anaerolineae bacterium]
MNQLSPSLRDHVLAQLRVTPADPSVELLDRLLTAYTSTVPWESASRIAKKARTPNAADRPRFPDEFWHDALTAGTGGTCYESNYAFISLLTNLGYDAYLTVNDMNETIGCHTAIVVRIGAERWLVDAGFPLYAAIRLEEGMESQRESPFSLYTVRPEPEQRYSIWRAPHPAPYMFTLIDKAIPEADYRAVTERDYGELGLFLDRVVINKIIDGQSWRFNSKESLHSLQRFEDGMRYDHPFEEPTAQKLSAHFGVAEEVLQKALDALNLNGSQQS